MLDTDQSAVWIKNPLAVYADNSDSGVVISGNKIIELVPLGSLPKADIDEVYDASNSVLLPGLINTHHHFYQTLTRAYPEALNKDLFPWLKSLYKVWANIEPEMLAVSIIKSLVTENGEHGAKAICVIAPSLLLWYFLISRSLSSNISCLV